MKAFTYRDYIKCIHTLRLNAVFKLAEESAKYNLKEENKTNKQMITSVLKRHTRELANLINDFLDTKQKIKYKDLIKYDDNYISRKYKIDKTKLIYKLKDKETFFLIKEVDKLDNIVLYEILNYCISVMQEWNVTNKIQKENKNITPIIIPIIIYIGHEKIKINNKKNNRIGDYIFKNYNINLDYNLIDINKLSTKFLIQKGTMISYMMLIEKLKNTKETNQVIETIILNTDNKNKLNIIKDIIKSNDILNEEEKKQLLYIIDNKEG